MASLVEKMVAAGYDRQVAEMFAAQKLSANDTLLLVSGAFPGNRGIAYETALRILGNRASEGMTWGEIFDLSLEGLNQEDKRFFNEQDKQATRWGDLLDLSEDTKKRSSNFEMKVRSMLESGGAEKLRAPAMINAYGQKIDPATARNLVDSIDSFLEKYGDMAQRQDLDHVGKLKQIRDLLKAGTIDAQTLNRLEKSLGYNWRYFPDNDSTPLQLQFEAESAFSNLREQINDIAAPYIDDLYRVRTSSFGLTGESKKGERVSVSRREKYDALTDKPIDSDYDGKLPIESAYITSGPTTDISISVEDQKGQKHELIMESDGDVFIDGKKIDANIRKQVEEAIKATAFDNYEPAAKLVNDMVAERDRNQAQR